MTARFHIKSPGRYTPACVRAELLCALIQGSTIDSHAIDIIKKLGFIIEILGE